jgi:hypothetical protein
MYVIRDRLCGLVYRSGGPGSSPVTTRKNVVGLERGPLSLVGTTEELLDRKVATPVYKTENTAVCICHADHVASSIRKKLAITSPTSSGRSVGIVRSRTQTMEFKYVIRFESGVYSRHWVMREVVGWTRISASISNSTRLDSDRRYKLSGKLCPVIGNSFD